MSEGKQLTLRKKGGRRPQISGPQQISGPVPSKQAPNSSGATLAVPKDRSLQPGGTSDLVKRRYSARFNQLPDFSAGAPPVPGLPQVPTQYAASRKRSPGRPGTAGSGKPLRIDVEALRDPNLQPEKCKTHADFRTVSNV